METLTLNWTPVKKINDKWESSLSIRGVYIWGFINSDVFMPYYVGQAENIRHRIFEHLASLLCGKYTIYRKEELFSYNKDLKPKYSPNWPESLVDFILDRKDIAEHLDVMVNQFAFTYAAVDKDCIHTLRSIESYCIDKIGRMKLSNSRVGAGCQVEVAHAGEESIRKFFQKIEASESQFHS